MNATKLMKSPRKIAEEILQAMKAIKDEKGRSTSISKYCVDYNNKNSGQKINKHLMSRLQLGKFKQVNARIEEICKDLNIEIEIEPEIPQEILFLIKKIPSSNIPHIKSILNELVQISQGKKQ